jgi:hypothetical protein
MAGLDDAGVHGTHGDFMDAVAPDADERIIVGARLRLDGGCMVRS